MEIDETDRYCEHCGADFGWEAEDGRCLRCGEIFDRGEDEEPKVTR